MGCVKTKTTIKCNKEEKKNNNNFELQNEKKSPDNKIDLDSNSKTYNASNKKNIINYNDVNNQNQNKILKDASEIDNNYFILEKISKNSISQNYKIQNKKNPSIFKTMKVLTKSTMQENDEELKIIQEIEILKGLKHENVIEIEQCYSDEKFFYIISEYSDYGSLKDQFGIKKKYSENQTKYIMYQLLKAIKYLNKNNFIHTDIKPENILISEKIIINKEELFKVKLVDFGNANSLQNPESKNLPYYVAPEVIDRKFNEKCDIWSLGIIMFRLLFGYVPFKGTSFDEVINNIKNSPIEYDKEDEQKNICLSENGEDILSKMIVRDVDKRFDVDSCISHKWFKFNNLSIIEEEKEKRYDVSPSCIDHHPDNKNTILLKTKFNKKDEDNIVNTGFYKMGTNIIDSPKKLNTFIHLPEDNYHFFLIILKKFILFFYRIYFKTNEEENIIREIYQKKENRDLSKISVKDVYDCTIEYAGMINYSVRYIVFKEQIKDDIKESFKNENFINFNSFKEFLIMEKENSIDIEFSNCFDKLIKKNKEEIVMCLDLDYSTKGKTIKYFNLIKKELENKIYTYEEFKILVKSIITNYNKNEDYNDNLLSLNSNDDNNKNNEEKKEFEIELKESPINILSDNDLTGIVNITKKKCSQNSDTLKSKSQLLPLRENTKKSKSSYNPKRDPNAFDPEKFLLLVDENYSYKNGN